MKANLLLKDFIPVSRLEVKETDIKMPRFPVIDAHNHLGDVLGLDWPDRPVSELLEQMDEARIQVYVDLDGGWGEDVLEQHLDHFKAAAPDRFAVFGGVDFSKWDEHGDKFGEWAAKRFREQVARGAQGLKLWKPFGLTYRDQHGKLISIDDERLDPVFETVAELNVPVVIHVADPVAFFDPIDETNERYEELLAHPDWQFPSPPYPPFMKIMNDFANLIRRHPKTDFIGAHVGCYSENLTWVSQLLDECPNFYVDISARISELGRQPYAARRFFLNYPDRILFGSDFGPDPAAYQIYYRFLETDDEYFNYNTAPTPLQGRWYIYGIFLPDDILEQVYFKNAERLIVNRGYN